LNFKRRGNAQIKPLAIPKIVEPSYVKKHVVAIEEKERNNIQSNHKREINVEYVVNGELFVIRRFLNV
jgi:hypothetical protein